MNFIDASQATTAMLDAGGDGARMPGALIYEYRPQITQVVEYGASADAVLSGQAPPAEGARFDFYLEGPVSGPKLQGTFRGVDYIYFRVDGRAELHIHGEITTEEGKRSRSNGALRLPRSRPSRALVACPGRTSAADQCKARARAQNAERRI